MAFDGLSQLKCYVRGVRPRPPVEPIVRFETPPGHQAQVDFAECRFPWGKRVALLVVLGYSRLLWVQFHRSKRRSLAPRDNRALFWTLHPCSKPGERRLRRNGEELVLWTGPLPNDKRSAVASDCRARRVRRSTRQYQRTPGPML